MRTRAFAAVLAVVLAGVGVADFAQHATFTPLHSALAPPVAPGAGPSSPATLEASGVVARPATNASTEMLPPDVWALSGFDLNGDHNNPHALSLGSAANSSGPALRWNVTTPGSIVGTPLIVGGVVFAADYKGNVFAYNLTNGSRRWLEELGHGPISASLAFWKGSLIVPASDGTILALNATSGQSEWNTSVAEFPATFLFAPPIVSGNVVYVGTSSTEEFLGFNGTPTFRGAVWAIAATNGTVLWKTYTVPPGDTGGSIWTGFAMDAANETLFVGAGNAYTAPAANTTDAILALNATSGDVRWSTQLVAHDIWTNAHPAGPDYDLGMSVFRWITPTGRAMVGAGTKNGSFVGLDARSGAVVFHVYPALPTPRGLDFFGGGAVFGNELLTGTVSGGSVVALQAGTGTLLWSAHAGGSLWAGVVVAADEAYGCTMTGNVFALDAANGAADWNETAPAAAPGTPASCYGAPATAANALVVPLTGPSYWTDPGGLAVYGTSPVD
ncbi:MAG: outer membrane protein assembly factor BamB family protein [Thermoplasmatota archaeon]